MAQVPALGYEVHWQNELASLRTEYKKLIKWHPEVRKVIELVHHVLNNIMSLVGCTPKNIGESEVWSCVVRRPEEDRKSWNVSACSASYMGSMC
jgi:hypothetical protein